MVEGLFATSEILSQTLFFNSIERVLFSSFLNERTTFSGVIDFTAIPPTFAPTPTALMGTNALPTSIKFSMSKSPLSVKIPAITSASPVIKLVRGMLKTSSTNSMGRPL